MALSVIPIELVLHGSMHSWPPLHLNVSPFLITKIGYKCPWPGPHYRSRPTLFRAKTPKWIVSAGAAAAPDRSHRILWDQSGTATVCAAAAPALTIHPGHPGSKERKPKTAVWPRPNLGQPSTVFCIKHFSCPKWRGS